MPLYEYQCDACGRRFELIRKFSDPPVTDCPTCGGAVRKLLSSPAIQFKGTGWYITDYARKPSAGQAASEQAAGDPKGAAKGKSAPEAKSGSADSGKASKSDAAGSGSSPGATER